jgi:hypothetical protein
MDTANQDHELPTNYGVDSDLEFSRSIIRKSLTEIADAVAIAMRSADLHFPLAIGVPSSGALITMMTPDDPTDEEWSGFVLSFVGL